MAPLWRVLAVCALAAHGAAQADDDWIPVSAARLDSMRGGFTTPAGLQIAIGVERLVSINGEQVSRTLLSAGMPGQLDAGRLIQNGAGNVFTESTMQAGATVIQNSLNNQIISTQTVITANLNSAALLRDLNFQQSLSTAAIAAAGSH